MPRQLRVEYPGAICHVLSRGDRKKDIYLNDVDRQDFLKTLAEACQKTGFELQARETTLTMREIAQRLLMGSWKGLNNKLCLARKAKEPKHEKAAK